MESQNKPEPWPLSVLQVVEPGVDGAFRHVEGLIRYLLEQDVRVHLAYSSQRDSEQLYELVNSVAKHGGQALDLKIGARPRPGDLLALAKLYKLARSTDVDVLHGHSSKAGVLTRVASKALGKPCLYTPHAYYGMSGRPGKKQSFYSAIERQLASWGHTINVSAEEQEFAGMNG